MMVVVKICDERTMQVMLCYKQMCRFPYRSKKARKAGQHIGTSWRRTCDEERNVLMKGLRVIRGFYSCKMSAVIWTGIVSGIIAALGVVLTPKSHPDKLVIQTSIVLSIVCCYLL